ncbi:MAG: hypothetical protein IJN49_01335, partial [Clostridia bacterium]|nr:hypothetical protein [Clostridia bacterium]
MRKILSCLLAVMMVLSLIPTTVFAADEQVAGEAGNDVSTTESNSDAIIVEPGDDLQSLINAIPVGGSGEFTIQDTQWYLEFGLYVENRDITLNLVNAQMGTFSFENGTAAPLILGYGANITLNLDENSRIEAQGHTGNMGVVRVDNSTDWNAETKTFPETFTLTVNGGSFNCVQVEENSEFEPDSVFVAAPGTKVVLTDVYCDGDVKEIDMAGVGIDVPGELVINSGKFTNDVSEYIADGHYCCEYDDYFGGSYSYYFVREKEMTDGFSKVLTDGKIVLNYDKSITQTSDALWLPCEDFFLANEEFYMSPEGFNDDFTKVELMFNAGGTKEERHTVDVIWNYDEKVSEAAQEFIKKFPNDERPWFNLTDMELVNYWAYKDTEGVKHTSLANYSGELKAILGNTNFLYLTDVRAGDDAIFYTATLGTGKLIHNGTVYFGSNVVGARAQHAIYVPENTGDTAEELIAAAQKRIDDYIGEDIVKITYADSTVTEYYNSEIANYDERYQTAQKELEEATKRRAEEEAKPENERDEQVISDCIFKIMECEYLIESIPNDKQWFINEFNEGNDYHFLTSAAGDFFFDIEVLRTGEVFKFVIIKDDTKLTLPSYTSVDLDTKVTVETDDSDVPLDTIINVEKLTQGTDYDKIMDVLDDIENEMFDIKLHSGSLNRFFTKLANGKFEVKIPVPEKFSGKNLVVYYVDTDNKPVEYEVNVKDGFAIFSTDHFSIYTLAEKHEHIYTGKITKEPTCTALGEKTFTCECGDTYTESVKENGHTSVNGGKADVHTKCDVCGVTLSTTHNTTSKITTEPTCTKEGVKTFTCSCGYSYTEAVSAKGHTETTLTGKAATCTEAGLTEGKKCSVCGT